MTPRNTSTRIVSSARSGTPTAVASNPPESFITGAPFKLGEVVYQQAQQAQQSTGGGDGSANGADTGGDEEIVDAEVVDESGDRA